jgi:hypothetical protein
LIVKTLKINIAYWEPLALGTIIVVIVVVKVPKILLLCF